MCYVVRVLWVCADVCNFQKYWTRTHLLVYRSTQNHFLSRFSDVRPSVFPFVCPCKCCVQTAGRNSWDNWMKFGTQVFIGLRTIAIEIGENRSMFRPSPHIRVYQNFHLNGYKTHMTCYIWLKFGSWTFVMHLNNYAKFDRNRPMFWPSPHI